MPEHNALVLPISQWKILALNILTKKADQRHPYHKTRCECACASCQLSELEFY